MILLRRIYTIYGLTVLALVYILFFPFFVILIKINNRHPLIYRLNSLWSNIFTTAMFMPVKRIYEEKPDKNKNYILCSNHFSFNDIPTLSASFPDAMFVGKDAFKKVPLFGYMYSRVHVIVERSRRTGGYEAFSSTLKELDEGRSLIIFPEGGIRSKKPPELARFMDGAFKAAIAKQIPIIPVTIPYNWIIFPRDKRFLFKWHKNVIIFHKPVETTGMSENDMVVLKEKVRNIIAEQLTKSNSK